MSDKKIPSVDHEKNDSEDEKRKIKKVIKSSNIKFYYGNPENEIIEGTLKTVNTRILINDKVNLSYEDLEYAKQYLWDFNLDNKYIKSKTLCCTNLKNKFSITEFIQAINTYLSYISLIRVFKSSIPNIYYIYIDFKNVEYCNIFYNTYQYSNINTIEDDYLIFDEVIEIEYDAFFSSKQKLSMDDSSVIDINFIKNDTFFRNEKRKRKFSYEYDINNHGVEDIRICTICLEDIGKKSKLKNDGLIYVLCGHAFHLECFVGMDDNKCPICRYYLSPYNIVTCEYCFQEKDLWVCLVCGKIFCGEEGKSQNHRWQHYQESLHLCCQGLGKSNNIIYDFSKSSPIHIWIQNSVLNSIRNEEEEKKEQDKKEQDKKEEDKIEENKKEEDKKENKINKISNLDLKKTDSNESENNGNINVIRTSSKKRDKKIKEGKKDKNNNKDNKEKTDKKDKLINIEDEDDINDIFKSSKEKTEYIISEYNSIISSQLENQRYYFLNEFKRRENKYLIEKQNLEEEIIKAEKELKKLEEEEIESENKKKEVFEIVKKKNNKKLELEKELEKTEEEFKILQKEKNIIDKNIMNKTENIDNQIAKVDEEIKDLNQQLKELNIHINTLNRLEKSDPEGIKNASLGMILDVSKSGSNYKKKKHHK